MTFNELAKTKRPYVVIKPPSIAYLFFVAIVADARGNTTLRDLCLQYIAIVAARQDNQ